MRSLLALLLIYLLISLGESVRNPRPQIHSVPFGVTNYIHERLSSTGFSAMDFISPKPKTIRIVHKVRRIIKSLSSILSTLPKLQGTENDSSFYIPLDFKQTSLLFLSH